MSNVSSAVVTINGVDYDPVAFNVQADNSWTPTYQGSVTLARKDLVAPTLSAVTNLMTNTSAEVDLTGAAGTACTLQRQNSWADSGAWCFALVGPAATDSFMTVGGASGGMRLGMQAGHTYTVSGTLFMGGVQTGTLSDRARKIVVIANTGSGDAVLASSDAAANIAQRATRLSLTFTLPAGTTSAHIRFYNGSTTATVRWDSLMLVEGIGLEPDGVTPLRYFDGSTPTNSLYTYAWAGTAYQSTSTRTPAFVSTDVTPILDPTLYPKVILQQWFGDPTAPPKVLNLSLLARSYEVDEVADTVTIRLCSEEQRLQDYKSTIPDWSPGVMALQDMVDFALQKVGLPLSGSIPVNPSIPATATVLKAGQSLDEWLRGALRSANLDLWDTAADRTFGFPDGTIEIYRLDNPSKDGRPGYFTCLYGVNMLEATWGVDVDSDEYADSAVNRYTWTDAAGATQVRTYITATPDRPRKVKTLELSTADPGFDSSLSTAIQTRRRRFTMTATAITGPLYGPSITSTTPYPMRIGTTFYYTASSGAVWRSTVNRVTWSYPDDSMQLGLYGLTPDTSAPVLPTPEV